MAGQTPLRFRDVLRQQVIAIRDISSGGTFQKDDVALLWTIYQPGAAVALEEVYGRKASRGVRKDGVVLIEFIKPLAVK
jgi:sialic acid synthase SpsE